MTMPNFLKNYDWVLLATVFVGAIAALCIYDRAKLSMDKRAMEASKAVAA